MKVKIFLFVLISFCSNQIYSMSCTLDKEKLGEFIDDFTNYIRTQSGVDLDVNAVRSQFFKALSDTALFSGNPPTLDVNKISQSMIDWAITQQDELSKNPINIAEEVRRTAIAQGLTVHEPGVLTSTGGEGFNVAEISRNSVMEALAEQDIKLNDSQIQKITDALQKPETKGITFNIGDDSYSMSYDHDTDTMNLDSGREEGFEDMGAF